MIQKLQFRGLHPNILIGMASDRYSGWIGQVYTEGRYTQGISHRTHKVGERSFVEEVLPVESVEEYFEHFPILEIDYTFYRLLLDKNGKPTPNYFTLKHPFFFPRAHDVLAMIAFVALVLSVMVNTGLVVKQGLSGTAPKDSTMFWSWISLTVLTLITIVGTSLSQLYLYCFARGLGQAPLVWSSRGVPFVFSLAFWEWLTCVFLIVYLTLLVGLTCRLKRKTLNNPQPSLSIQT
jgi:hypothetical protein